MNLANPEWELIDPTPNVHNLFVHFDELFFDTKLAGRAVVRWSKRMYSCAGVCSYEGRNGLCDIALSEPLLKLRPRKDLIETLLHEMIHAFLFITNRDNDRDGHGPNFQFHMHRINKAAGLNITIYHDFHDEVKLYLTHVWRCNGICQNMKPYFGIVRRSSNRGPGPNDRWWNSHRRFCGGTFVKIQEPEKKEKAPKKTEKAAKKTEKGKTNVDITKYINNNSNIGNKNINKSNKVISNVVNVNVLKNNKENKIIPPLPSASFDKIMKTNVNSKKTTDSVIEKVRDVWKNKILPTSPTVKPNPAMKPPNHLSKVITSQNESVTTKHKKEFTHKGSPSKKMKKIDDYFINSAQSILKDVYGKDFVITQAKDGNKLKAVAVGQDNNCNVTELVNKIENMVNCPSCNRKVAATEINRHLDECLNKDLIETLSKESTIAASLIHNDVQIKKNDIQSKDIVGHVPESPSFKFKTEKHIKVDTSKQIQNNNLEGILISKQNIPDITIKHEKLVNHVHVSKIETNKSISTNKGLSHQHKQLLLKNDQIHKEINEIINYTKLDENDFNKNTPTSKNVCQICPCCGKILDKPFALHSNECLEFFDNNTTVPVEAASSSETVVIADDFNPLRKPIKIEPGTSKDNNSKQNEIVQKCPCCGIKVEQTIELHLDECLGFFNDDNELLHEGASAVDTIVIDDDDDDDEFDETQTLNATGTKSLCPCCLKMFEIVEMSEHLDICLQL